MNVVLIFPSYIRWHYGRAVSDLHRLWKTLLSFIYNFFSVPLLVTNLFSPWRRMADDHLKSESFGDMMFTMIFNTIMRGVGFVIRLLFVVTGVIGLVLGTILGVVSFIVWYALPAIMVYLLFFGIHQLSL